MASRIGNFGNNAGPAEKLSYFSNLFKGNDKDSDNDGLKDWEETLWKTDKNNSDTDGDGTSDGEEVKAGRNPLKPGPDDKIETPVFKQEGFFENTLGAGLTKTDILAREFFASFMSLRQSGNIDEQTRQKLAESFLTEINQEKLADKYKISDIKTIDDNSGAALKNYGNEAAGIINKYQADIQENEIDIINRAMEENNENEMRKLGPIIQMYLNISGELIKISAPKGVSLFHLNLINSVYNLAESLKKIKDTFKDPVNGIIGINQYKEEYAGVKEALLNISRYFTDKGIIFSSSEKGYKFFINNR